MEKINELLGWDVFDETHPPIEQPENSLSPQEQLLDAILKKDSTQLSLAISLGANPKVLVGKEKMAVFAMRNFAPDVVKVLQKNGVSFKDFNSMQMAVFETDNLDAFQWMLENKKHSEISDFLIYAVNAGACNVFNHIIEKMDEDKKVVKFNQLSSHIVSLLLSNALTMGNDKTITYLLENKKDNQMEQMFKMFFRQTKCSKIQLQNLSKMLSSHPQCIPIFKSSIKRVGFYIPPSEALRVPGFKNCYSPNESSLEVTGITTLLEFLVYQNNDIVVDVFARPAGKQKLAKIIEQRGEFFFSFLASQASRELRQGILKSTKEIWRDWRDQNNSNAFHYLASRTSLLKTLCEDLYVLDSELLTTADDTGKTPLMSFPADHAATVTKKMLKKELRSVGIPVSVQPQSSKRKM